MMTRNFCKIIAIITLITCFSSIPAILHGQQDVKIKKREFRAGDEGFKNAWKSIKEADKLYASGRGSYKDALSLYLKAHAYNPYNAELNYKIGVCYLNTDHKYNAVEFLKRVHDVEPKLTKDLLYLLARAYHLNTEFDKAIEHYDLYFRSLRLKERKRLPVDIEKLKRECANGKQLITEPRRVIIKSVGEGVNSRFDDYNSIVSPNDSVMFFTSRRPDGRRGDERLRLDNKFYEDIRVSYKQDGEWSESRNLGKVNTKRNDAALALSANGKRLFVYNGKKKGGSIRVSEYQPKKAKWSSSDKLKGPMNTRRWRETTITFTPDESVYYFVSNNHKTTTGGKDIYMTQRNAKGKFKKAVNLGPTINTPFDEESPYILPSGNVLYFSSKGHNSMGGYDIFRSEKDARGNWTPPVNIGYPVNTPDDDLFFYPNSVEKQAYLTSIRNSGVGLFDIFKVTFLGEEKEMLLDEQDITLGYYDSPFDGLFMSMPVEVVIDTAIFLRGTITDAVTSVGVLAKISLIDIERSEIIATTIAGEDGSYQITLPSVKNYGIEINAKDYMFLLDLLEVPVPLASRVITKNFVLNKLEVGTKVVLNNIFFETNKATLTPPSYAELDKVLKFMQDNPTLVIEISGHTDNVGSLKANTNLSEARARSVVNYLTGHGIAQDRLQARGYAFTQPIAPNDTPEGRAMNRRVEFKVLSK